MRLFIGVKLPERIKKYLAEVKNLFPKEGLKFVEEENIHITIKFIGETSMSEAIIKALDKISFKQFKARLYGLSVFPNERFIRVIHSPITIGKDEFFKLHELIDKALKPLGFNEDKDFTPHATIARVKKPNNDLIKIANSVKFSDEFIVESFTLFSSQLTSKGPVYSLIKDFKAEKQ